MHFIFFLMAIFETVSLSIFFVNNDSISLPTHTISTYMLNIWVQLNECSLSFIQLYHGWFFPMYLKYFEISLKWGIEILEKSTSFTYVLTLLCFLSFMLEKDLLITRECFFMAQKSQSRRKARGVLCSLNILRNGIWGIHNRICINCFSQISIWVLMLQMSKKSVLCSRRRL